MDLSTAGHRSKGNLTKGDGEGREEGKSRGRVIGGEEGRGRKRVFTWGYGG